MRTAWAGMQTENGARLAGRGGMGDGACAMNRPLPDPDATLAFGREVGLACGAGDVVALVGELGSGKTWFVKGMAAGLGHPGEVTSQTFTLAHEYEGGRLPLFHFDFYRLDHPDDLLALGWDDYLDAGGVVVAEWADRFPALVPPAARWIELRHDGTGGRVASILPSPPTPLAR